MLTCFNCRLIIACDVTCWFPKTEKMLNTLTPEQNDSHIADCSFKSNFGKNTFVIWSKFQLSLYQGYDKLQIAIDLDSWPNRQQVFFLTNDDHAYWRHMTSLHRNMLNDVLANWILCNTLSWNLGLLIAVSCWYIFLFRKHFRQTNINLLHRARMAIVFNIISLCFLGAALQCKTAWYIARTYFSDMD